MTDVAAGEALGLLGPQRARPDWTSAGDALIAVITNRLHSDVSRRGYRSALRQFLAWHLSQAQDGGAVALSRALVQRYRVTLERRNLAPSTINQHLSAIRALADECADSGLLDQPTAAAIGRVKGVPARRARRELADPRPGRKAALSPAEHADGPA